ncbi:GVQW3 [Cordylochernes scorpioides]|uniref:GVQW3 n=1 Tax=Cordylochernes scorpioides TaxID=51811 RepID=A0ABY6LH31_9ARAC|nr:GVQW3 [Cordylochernes scorpioides]
MASFVIPGPIFPPEWQVNMGQCNPITFQKYRLAENRIKFCFKLKKIATETYELIKEAFGDAALSRSRNFEWFSRFPKGREKVNDDQHTGRPRSLRCEENKLKIKELIKSNRRITIKDLSSETGLSVGLCHQIVTKDLDMIRASSKFVPRILIKSH